MTMIDWRRDEEWYETRPNPAYFISTHGRVYSVAAKRLVAVSLDKHRSRVTASIRTPSNATTTITVASEVLLAFGPPQTRRRVPAYIDGDVTNCRFDNLYWVDSNTAEFRDSLERIRAFMLRQAAREAEQETAAAPAAGAAKRDRSAPPGGIVTPEGVAQAIAAQRSHADLSVEEKRLIREWYVARGGTKRGRLPTDAIAAYDHEHRAPVGAGAP